MRYALKSLWTGLLVTVVLSFGAHAATVIEDDYTPEVTARVVRISLMRGEAQIRRSGGQEWERATLNLPLVEGDEITTDQNSRLEIQLDSWNFIRLAENSYLKLTTLRDEGVAVSLPQGTLSLRVGKFRDDENFFEIDAPKTTIAVKKTGLYRVDSGDSRSLEVRLKVTDGGEARIYSDSSGFSLRNGRTARLFLEGNYAGEWETSDASRYTDEFDSWALERDAVVAKRLRNANYDQYYDRDMYGAEDLNDYGEWIFTRSYGYVWRPYRSATSSWSSWSPYRYGHWRWVPPYGWTWINDEPWGWATYHHGRWVWDSGYWYWSPYGAYRWRRSWWRPAMVGITTWGNSVCWYPLPYNAYYYDYNRQYYGTTIYNTTIINNNRTVIINPRPTPRPTPGVITETMSRQERWNRLRQPPLAQVPPGGVVGVAKEEFGRGTRNIRRMPPDVAGKVITMLPYDGETPPILPDYKEVKGKVDPDILIPNQRITRTLPPVATGASERKSGVPLDQELEKKRIYGDRVPLPKRDGESPPFNPSEPMNRKTGGIDRTIPVPRKDTDERSERPAPRWEPPQRDTGGKSDDGEPRPERRPVPKPVDRGGKDENQSPPIIQPPVQPREERKPPRWEPPQKEEKPKYEPPQREEKPRYEPPPRREEPRPMPPRYEPPQREEKPRYEPPPRREQPKPMPPRSDPPRSEPPRKVDPPMRKPSPKTDDSKDN